MGGLRFRKKVLAKKAEPIVTEKKKEKKAKKAKKED